MKPPGLSVSVTTHRWVAGVRAGTARGVRVLDVAARAVVGAGVLKLLARLASSPFGPLKLLAALGKQTLAACLDSASLAAAAALSAA